jgi:hypothetical protein
MTDDEIQIVAEELAKIGGLSWYPGRPSGAFVRAVSEGYLEQARTVITTLDGMRASKPQVSIEQERTPARSQSHEQPTSVPRDKLRVGAVVEYHPPMDKRTITCRIEELDEGHARLEPLAKPDIGWVVLGNRLRSPARDSTGEA